jgi:hypothetical protein
MPAKDVFIFSSQKALQRLAAVIQSADSCYYLNDDYQLLTQIRKIVGPSNPVRLLEKRFHRAVEALSCEFLRFSHTLNFRNRSDTYWGNQLGSRNSASIPLLRNMAYLRCAMELIQEVKGRLILICDSPGLARVIAAEAQIQRVPCRLSLSLRDWLRMPWLYLRLIPKGVYFLLKGLLQWIYAKMLPNERIDAGSIKNRYVLSSWITAGCIDSNGNHRDRNFGILPSWLEGQGKEVWIIPMYFNLDRSIFDQMKLMAASPTRFLFPEQYLSAIDYLRVLRDGIRNIFIDLSGIRFEGRSVNLIVREVHIDSCLPPEQLQRTTVTYVLKNLSRKKIAVQRFLFPIENNASEKIFMLAARKFYPGVPVVGFQHTVWLKEQLAMFLLPDEQSYYPMPDRLITSGRRYVDILERAGYPRILIVAGPNLRYAVVNDTPAAPYSEKDAGCRKLLVILNFDFNQSLELLEKSGQAFKNLQDVKIRIKAHPTTPLAATENFLREIGFPPYVWASGSVQEWVLQSDAVLMTGGSVSNLETMATGVPLLRISLGSSFDFDCLWDDYPFAPFLHTTLEIRQFLEKAFTMESHLRETLVAFGKRMVTEYFEPVTPETMQVFL